MTMPDYSEHMGDRVRPGNDMADNRLSLLPQTEPNWTTRLPRVQPLIPRRKQSIHALRASQRMLVNPGRNRQPVPAADKQAGFLPWYSRQSVLERELDMELAAKVHCSFLPQAAPTVPGLQISVASQPVAQIGGDFYDFIQDAQGELCFTVGDISGKGVSAGLFVPVLTKVMRTGVRTGAADPCTLMDYVSTDLYAELAEAGMFITLFTATYTPLQRRIRYANAGHSPVILHRADGRSRLLAADGTPLGVRAACGCIERTLQLAPGDLLVMATDGFSEAHNQLGEILGQDSLLRLIGRIAHYPAALISDLLFQAIARFRGRQTQQDDQTLVVMKAVG